MQMDFVGHAHRARLGVGLAVGHDRLEAHAAAGAQDAHGDLAAVGDEDALDHQARRHRPVIGRVRLELDLERIDVGQRLAVLDGLAVLGQDVADDAVDWAR